jgi:hypothetical protein
MAPNANSTASRDVPAPRQPADAGSTAGVGKLDPGRRRQRDVVVRAGVHAVEERAVHVAHLQQEEIQLAAALHEAGRPVVQPARPAGSGTGFLGVESLWKGASAPIS